MPGPSKKEPSHDLVEKYAGLTSGALRRIALGKLDDPVLFARQVLFLCGASTERYIDFQTNGRPTPQVEPPGAGLGSELRSTLEQLMVANQSLGGGK
jgi:hypothetical protein